MSNLRSTIEALASQFASNVLDALRRASIDELAGVAGRSASARRGVGRSADGGEAAGGAARKRGRGGRLGRRSAADIARMIDSIVGVLQKSQAGLRAENIRELLGVEAKELPRPLAEAVASGRVTKTGQKRATTYFAGTEGGGAAPKRRGRAAGRRPKKR